MPGEQRLETTHEHPRVLHFSDEVVRRVAEVELADAPVALHNEAVTLYELYRGPVVLPGIADAQFSLQYRQYAGQWKDDFDGLLFDYETVQHGVAAQIAALEFDRIMPRRFKMNHRYVEPQYRDRRGIGTQLLRQAEQLFQQLADRTQQRQRLEIELRQRNVLEWIIKNGFAPEPTHLAQVQAVREHPERFISRDVVDGRDDTLKADCIFPIDTTDFTLQQAIRLRLFKIITQRRSAQAATEPGGQ
jgi:ribosomal protein S18 acetylase RimI-like enzyme